MICELVYGVKTNNAILSSSNTEVQSAVMSVNFVITD